MASGNYLAIIATKDTGVSKVTCQIIPGNKPEQELDEDMNVVFRIASTDQVIRFKAYDSANKVLKSETFALTGLTLEPEEE